MSTYIDVSIPGAKSQNTVWVGGRVGIAWVKMLQKSGNVTEFYIDFGVFFLWTVKMCANCFAVAAAEAVQLSVLCYSYSWRLQHNPDCQLLLLKCHSVCLFLHS